MGGKQKDGPIMAQQLVAQLRKRPALPSLCSLSKASSRSTWAGSDSSSDIDAYGTVTPPESPAAPMRSGSACWRSWSLLIETDNLAPLSYVVRNTFVDCVESEPLVNQSSVSCPACKVGGMSAIALDKADDESDIPVWPATPLFPEDVPCPPPLCLETVVAPPCVTGVQAVLCHPVVNIEETASIPPPPEIHAESTLKEEQLQQLATALHARIAELERSSDAACTTFQPGDGREAGTNQEQSAQWNTLRDLGLLL